jgi:putative transposase
MAKLRPLADRAAAEAARMQKLGKKPRESAVYRDLVARMRGLINTEINHGLNRLVALHRPHRIILEKLDFRGCDLSRRMNRLLTNCGRGAVQRKIADLEQRLGIVVEEVDPAYSSQTCSSCGFVHPKNRSGEIFRCRACGLRIHADVNGARNLRTSAELAQSGPTPVEPPGRPGTGDEKGRPDRRKRKQASSGRGRSARSDVLREIVRRYDERNPTPRRPSRPRKGSRGSPSDPRVGNPYFRRFSRLTWRAGAGSGMSNEAAAFAAAT